MDLQTCRDVGEDACHPTASTPWRDVDRPALRTVVTLMRVTASIAGGVHIALRSGQHATHEVGESLADGTITANPGAPTTPSDTGH